MSKRIGTIRGDLIEVKAYRELQTTPFDFGTGLITHDSRWSEDAYYEMIEQDLEEELGTLKDNKSVEVSRKVRSNRYIRKGITREKLKKLKNRSEHQRQIHEKEDEETGNKYLKISYYSGKRKHAKRATNKKIRSAKYHLSFKKGNYRKTYDYDREVF